GFGKLEISDETARRLQAENGKPVAMQTMTAATVDYDCTMGLMYSKNLKVADLTLGLGYNIGGQVAFSFGGGDLYGNKDTAHVRASPMPYLMHYGPILKAMVKW
ncbi:MAG: hypothetical protein PHW69_09495, partial [Elusimicrobiaceae bacterium]|nr:hypothetical protein [Elusimicrobiaceae bacterium]